MGTPWFERASKRLSHSTATPGGHNPRQELRIAHELILECRAADPQFAIADSPFEGEYARRASFSCAAVPT